MFKNTLQKETLEEQNNINFIDLPEYVSCIILLILLRDIKTSQQLHEINRFILFFNYFLTFDISSIMYSSPISNI